MAILQETLRSVCASFPPSCKGQRRAAWLVFAILAIAMPFVSSRTSDILRWIGVASSREVIGHKGRRRNNFTFPKDR